jgi:predicted  nucleic acid-binding Zn-ribbon protein
MTSPGAVPTYTPVVQTGATTDVTGGLAAQLNAAITAIKTDANDIADAMKEIARLSGDLKDLHAQVKNHRDLLKTAQDKLEQLHGKQTALSDLKAPPEPSKTEFGFDSKGKYTNPGLQKLNTDGSPVKDSNGNLQYYSKDEATSLFNASHDKWKNIDSPKYELDKSTLEGAIAALPPEAELLETITKEKDQLENVLPQAIDAKMGEIKDQETKLKGYEEQKKQDEDKLQQLRDKARKADPPLSAEDEKKINEGLAEANAKIQDAKASLKKELLGLGASGAPGMQALQGLIKQNPDLMAAIGIPVADFSAVTTENNNSAASAAFGGVPLAPGGSGLGPQDE